MWPAIPLLIILNNFHDVKTCFLGDMTLIKGLFENFFSGCGAFKTPHSLYGIITFIITLLAACQLIGHVYKQIYNASPPVVTCGPHL